MNLRQIEAFKAVMETGTVTMAAARLRVSQPAASKLLQSFERVSGLILFSRERGRLSPTPEARLLYEEVEQVFQGAGRVRQAAEEIRTRQRGILSIGVMPALSVGFAQEVLARLSARRPGVAVTLQSRDTPRLVEQLVTHQIELYYSVHPVEHPEIRTESLGALPLVCIVPPHHRLAKLREISCRDLAAEPFAALRRDTATRRKIDQAFADEKIRLKIALETPMAPALCAFVARGSGVSIVNPLYVGAFAPALAVRPFKKRIESELLLARPRTRRISVLAEAFADESRAYVAEWLRGDRARRAFFG